MLNLMLVVTAIVAGFITGAGSVREYGIAAAIAGGLLGAAVGLAIAILQSRLVTWLIGTEEPKISRDIPRAWAIIYEYVYALAMLFGVMFSYLGLILTVAFLLRSNSPKPGALSREQCLALFSSLALIGYVILWGAQRLAGRFSRSGDSSSDSRSQ